MTPRVRPIFMGVVNVTPNSFSDGNQFLDPTAAVGQARKLVNDGAEIIDLGAEASSFFRAGVEPVAGAEQLRRLMPVVEELADVGRVSIDTRSAEVAAEMIRLRPGAGRLMINDISAGTFDSEMLRTVAGSEASLVLMHMSPGFPETPGEDDGDIVGTVREYLRERIAAAVGAGIPKSRLLVDPGLGFGKTVGDNWRLVERAEELVPLGCPVVVGASRKRFLQSVREVAGRSGVVEFLDGMKALEPLAEHERDLASAATAVLASRRGVQVHRVHNVALAKAAFGLFP